MRVSAGVVTLSFTNIEQEMCDRTPDTHRYRDSTTDTALAVT